MEEVTKMLSRFVIITLCIGMTYSAVWMGYNPPKPEEFADKEGCYVEEIKDVIPFGKTIHPIGFCYRISCGGLMMDYASCGVVNTDDPHCHVTDEDVSKPYPECCPDIKCESENNID